MFARYAYRRTGKRTVSGCWVSCMTTCTQSESSTRIPSAAYLSNWTSVLWTPSSITLLFAMHGSGFRLPSLYINRLTRSVFEFNGQPMYIRKPARQILPKAILVSGGRSREAVHMLRTVVASCQWVLLSRPLQLSCKLQGATIAVPSKSGSRTIIY